VSDGIILSGLRAQAIVGIFPEERRKPQPVVADVRLFLDLGRAGRTGDLAATVDYGSLATQLCFLLETARFRLLETAAVGLLAHILTPYPGGLPLVADEAEVELAKPDVLGGRAVPRVRLRRKRGGLTVDTRATPDGAAQILLDSPEVTIARLHRGAAAPSGVWPPAGTPAGTLQLSETAQLSVYCRELSGI
jgi:dihydroneopterin aldolase